MPGTSSTVAAGELGIRDITMTASTVDTVTFARDCEQVEVMKTDSGTASIYFTVDGSVPTVSGKNTYRVPGLQGAALKVTVTGAGNTVVTLISSGTPTYDVTGSL